MSSWEAVARDGREFAERGAGMMYWFKVPLGGVCYPEGFRNFLQPALENARIRKVRFVLDGMQPIIRQTWHELVRPLIEDWATTREYSCTVTERADAGTITLGTNPSTAVSWIFDDLSTEFSPTFKFLVPDPDVDDSRLQDAQIFLASATRRVRFQDGTQHAIRVPDTVIRIGEEDDRPLLMALNLVANQWDTLF